MSHVRSFVFVALAVSTAVALLLSSNAAGMIWPTAAATRLLPVADQQRAAQQHAPDAIPGELIVRFAPETSAAGRTATVAFAGGVEARRLRVPGYSLVSVPPGREQEFSDRLRALANVESVEPNVIRRASFEPNDPQYDLQWHLAEIGLETAWDKATGAGVTVAVLDTGIAFEDCAAATCGDDYTQAPDFAGTSFGAAWDFSNDDAHPNDENGHGTLVASVIAEATDNGLAVAGAAFDTTIMPVQVLDSFGAGPIVDVANGIIWAVDNGADIINLSLGGEPAPVEESAIAYALNQGVIVVAASGNGGLDDVGDPELSCPACYPGVIAVGATGMTQVRAAFSNYGEGLDGHTLDLVAPGVAIVQQSFAHYCSSDPFDLSEFLLCSANGTSMAGPLVAAVAALLLSIDPTFTPQEIGAILRTTATDLGPPGYDLEYGHGLLNAAAAVVQAQGSPPTATPTPMHTPTPTATPCADFDGDTLCDEVDPDDDNDGCTDAKELGLDPAAGGQRDPLHFWDFFDINRDGSISILDIFDLLSRFGATGDASIDPLTEPPPPPVYHTRFDRGPQLGTYPWNIGAADGAIAITDVFALLAQFGHSCA